MSEERPRDHLPTEDWIALLADVARKKGIAVLQVGSIRLEMGPAPAVATEPARELTREERDAAEEAGKLAAKRLRLRKLLGRNPTDGELEDLP